METAFGRWTVVEEAPRRGRVRYLRCRCACGIEREVAVGSLRQGTSTSCGCYGQTIRLRHGAAANRTMTAEYRAWTSMRQRCENPKRRGYHDYGARGIRVCERWRISFEAFLADVGPRPSADHSIDRIDNDGHYEPGNVRWATRSEQLANTRLSPSDRGKRGAAKRWATH